ncbi:hypothetical protein B0H10DRAFT_2428861 [Mycena sp. CBHHK59/15]|nr:hypothetical protein B0H10DRAFT_2428861 [Mycena sp. CBHHK59/15]
MECARERPRCSSSRASRSPRRCSPRWVSTHTHPELWPPEFWTKIGLSALLVLAGALPVLMLGLMGFDEPHLRVLAASSEDPAEKRNAKRVRLRSSLSPPRSRRSRAVLHLMEKGRHWVLVMLLLASVIGGGFEVVALSTTTIASRFISRFHDIIPSPPSPWSQLSHSARKPSARSSHRRPYHPSTPAPRRLPPRMRRPRNPSPTRKRSKRSYRRSLPSARCARALA